MYKDAKEKILESWIMIEHLSEGDINLKDKSILSLNDLENQDFYTLFLNEMQKRKISKKKQGGIVIYFDIFSFAEVIDRLREKFKLKPTEEESFIGNKFSLALYFDKNLNFNKDMTFYSESAYIRDYGMVPREKEFREFEEKLKEDLSQNFEDSSKDSTKFNEAIQKAMIIYNKKIAVENCRMQIVNNLETDATNLHSFYIDDLESAKSICVDNLEKYLSGNQFDRINLDGKNNSINFNPVAFDRILQPENYPLGRFPSKTEFALSLMQQVAVNLSRDYNTNQMRSVNGPPGTGKTTLLKDVFADLVVKQSYDICKLVDHCISGTEKTIYWERASIGELPNIITKNNIVVTSSNNGAVQNIVNELPLSSGIDRNMINELKGADYFFDIANSKISAEWKEDENGKKYEQLNREHNQEELFWGLFSLEGGKSYNMTNILTNMKHVIHYLDEQYESNPEIYNEFEEQYKEVETLRSQVQKTAKDNSLYLRNCQELSGLQTLFYNERPKKEDELNESLKKLSDLKEEYSLEAKHLETEYFEICEKENTIGKNKKSVTQLIDNIDGQKPRIWDGRVTKNEYKNRKKEILDQLQGIVNEEINCRNHKGELKQNLQKTQKRLNELSKNENDKKQEYNEWNSIIQEKISQLARLVDEYISKVQKKEISPLDMTKDYDDLQKSNPWFNESYRIAQSKLFITALRVRKQFLYENVKNLKAATIIWNDQNKYVDNKEVIVAAFNWINMTIPVISSTFASFSRMCKNLGPETLGHLFVDEAGQALPQASVGAIYRSRYVMVVGDPSQIKPVLTLDSSVLSMLSKYFDVSEKYLSDSASTQTLMDAASQYGFYREADRSDASWIGIPLWVHRRCNYPMFTISNKISYNGLMVQGNPGNGKAGWYDIEGKANNKYVEEQGEFLIRKIKEMMDTNPKIADKNEEDIIYVISPFANVAYQLAIKLRNIKFTRYDEHGKSTNVGTIHTFQGKEAPIVFLVLGADYQCSGAARWAVGEPNMMNVAATRAKKEFYVIGGKKLFLGIGSDVVNDTYEVMNQYKKNYPELVDDDVQSIMGDCLTEESKEKLKNIQEEIVQKPTTKVDENRIMGTINYVGKGRSAYYAYVSGDNKKEYVINEILYSETNNAENVIIKGNKISFIPVERDKKAIAIDVELVSK